MSELKDILRVSLVQPDLAWENREENLQRLTTLTSELQNNTDLIVLPEMFSTGFSMQPSVLAESEAGNTVQWLKALAHKLGAAIVGSLIIEAGGNYYNRLFFMRPDGSFETYDKKHLFSFADEQAHYSAGTNRLIVEYKGWRICPLVCYDLRFPVWSRNAPFDGSSSDTEYDLLLYVANWPEARRKPWMNLLEARAHENQAYVVGVNRVGMDGNGISHTGDSNAFSPKGEELTDLKSGKVGLSTVSLSKPKLDDFRAKFTPWKDKERFRLTD